MIAASQNENSRHMVNMGMSLGEPDLRLYCRYDDGILHMLYLELKTKKGRLQPSQIEWNKEFDEHYAAPNCHRAVAYGFAEAKEIITEWIGK
jgi:hypothetical protein